MTEEESFVSMLIDEPQEQNSSRWPDIHNNYGRDLTEDLQSSLFSLKKDQNNSTSTFIDIIYENPSAPIQTIPLITEKKEEKSKKKIGNNNYQKNICAYITKKIVQQFLDSRSQKIVRILCKKAACSIEFAMDYYRSMSSRCFGVNHLSELIFPMKAEEVGIKKMFCKFVKWFLRNKYMYYMLKFGKMEEKEIYIQYKNKYFLYITEVQDKTFELV